MHVIRGMRAALLVLGAAACTHDDPTTIITRDGVDEIPVMTVSTSEAGGAPTGIRTINRFLVSGPFDTSVTDAFARSSTNPADFQSGAFPDCGFYGPLIYAPGPNPVATYVAPNRYLPALFGSARAVDLVGCGSVIAYIVQSGNVGNGSGNTVWEFWHEFDQLTPVTRYIMGVARYALEQRGALDIAEILLTGTVTDPDSLVFVGFAPAGKKATTVWTTSCTSTSVIQPTAGANPHYLGSGASSASGRIDLDQTVCANAASAWGGLGTSRSPVPRNNFASPLGASQYNFFVVWEALADSTPNYARPVYRHQIGPLYTVAGAAVNNAFGPVPAAALTPLQMGPLPGSTSRPDTIRATFNTLRPLTTGAYQVWLVRAGTDTVQRVSGRVIRLDGTTVVDTVPGAVSEFNLTAAANGARVEFDYGDYLGVAWDAVTLAIQPTTGVTTLGVSQPLWRRAALDKAAGVLAQFSAPLTFGTFDNGRNTVVYGPAGTGTGGIFGRELRLDLQRLQRPPGGYRYDGWLVNTSGGDSLALGTILEPFPSLAPLNDADTMQELPLSGVELTRAALRYFPSTYRAYCRIASLDTVTTSPLEVDTTIAAIYDRVQVRLTTKNSVSGLPTTVTLAGQIGLPLAAALHKNECEPL